MRPVSSTVTPDERARLTRGSQTLARCADLFRGQAGSSGTGRPVRHGIGYGTDRCRNRIGSGQRAAGAACRRPVILSVLGKLDGGSGSRLSPLDSASHGGRAPPAQEPAKTIRSVSQEVEPTTPVAKSHRPSRRLTHLRCQPRPRSEQSVGPAKVTELALMLTWHSRYPSRASPTFNEGAPCPVTDRHTKRLDSVQWWRIWIAAAAPLTTRLL